MMKKILFFLVCILVFNLNVKADVLVGRYFLNNFDEDGHKLNKNNGVFEFAADNSAKWYSYKEPYLKMSADYFLLNFSLSVVVSPDVEVDTNSLWKGDYRCMAGHSSSGEDIEFYCSQQDLNMHYVVPGDAKFSFYVRAIWDDENWSGCYIQNSFANNSTLRCPIMNKNSKLKGIQIVSSGITTGNAGVHGVYSFDSQIYAYKNDSTIIQENQQQNNENAQKQLEESKKQTEEQKKQTDFITSDEAPSADVGALGNIQGIFPPGPLDSLLNIPFKVGSVVVSSLSGTCVPLSGTWVFDEPLSIPCFSDIIYDDMNGSIMTFIDLIPGGFLLIYYFKHLYKKIDRAVSLETTSDDEWGCI